MDVLTKLFISGYPLEMDEMQLVQVVSTYGEVNTVKIVRDKITRKPKGYAFLEMTSREAAENVCIALDGAELQGKRLALNITEDKLVPPPPVYKKVERFSSPEKKKRPRRQG